MFAEEVPHTRTVAQPDARIHDRNGVADDESRLVPDPGTKPDSADQVVDLLAGRPRLRRAEPEPLVEGADLGDQLPPQEDRERDRAIPEVVVGERDGISPPRGGGPAGLVLGAPCETVQPRLVGEPCRDAFERPRWVGAVVVGESDDVRGELRERGVARASQAS